MVDFSHFSSLKVKDNTARYEMDQITIQGESPVLIVSPATEDNKPYFNELLKRAASTSRKFKRGKISVDMLSQNREEDRGLYPIHIIKSWEKVYDSSGEPVPFSVDAAKEFVAMLPTWLFDDLRAWCGEVANFIDTLDVEITAKN